MKHCYLLILLFGFCKARCQPAPDTSFYRQSVNTVLNNYKASVQENLHLYTGKEYIRPGHGMKGTPFFESDSLLSGTVFYDGKPYENITLMYDLTDDAIIINNYTGNNYIQLVPEKIDHFSVLQHKFERIKSDSATASFMRTGFYEKLFEGKMTVFVRREKRLKNITINDTNAEYIQYDYYYIRINNSFYPVDDKRLLLNAAADKKDELKKFIKDNKINFNKDRGNALVKIAAYYSQIKN